MENFVSNNYLLLKSLHIIAIICWMAGLLYLPRLFVYHTKINLRSGNYEMLLIMEFRLMRYIMMPSMICSFLFGSLLLYTQTFAVWLHIKLLLVFLLASAHGLMIRCYKDFAHYKNKRSEKFFRILNEVPTILMIVIVIMAVMKL